MTLRNLAKSAVLITVLSLAAVSAGAQQGGTPAQSGAQSGASSSSSSSMTGDELDDMLAEFAVEALQCVVIYDVASANTPSKAAEYAPRRVMAAQDYQDFSGDDEDGMNDYLVELTKSYKDQLAKGVIDEGDMVESCDFDYGPEAIG